MDKGWGLGRPGGVAGWAGWVGPVGPRPGGAFSFPFFCVCVSSVFFSFSFYLIFFSFSYTTQVNPMKGLDVMLTGSGANGAVPTALSPTVLNVNWIC